jgi:hypothetical protein
MPSEISKLFDALCQSAKKNTFWGTGFMLDISLKYVPRTSFRQAVFTALKRYLLPRQQTVKKFEDLRSIALICALGLLPFRKNGGEGILLRLSQNSIPICAFAPERA